MKAILFWQGNTADLLLDEVSGDTKGSNTDFDSTTLNPTDTDSGCNGTKESVIRILPTDLEGQTMTKNLPDAGGHTREINDYTTRSTEEQVETVGVDNNREATSMEDMNEEKGNK